MINDELMKIWKSSSKTEQIKFDKSRLIIEMQTSIDQFERTIKNRDRREILGSAIVIVIFLYVTFTIPYFISKIASGLIVFWAINVICQLLKVKKIKPSEYSEDYLSYLKKNSVYFKKQKEILDSIFWWYIAPFLFCLFLFVSGFIGESSNNSIIITITGGLIVSGITYMMNKNASKKELDPKIKKLESLIRILENEEG